MGKTSRALCVLTPCLLTAVSFTCLAVLQTQGSSHALSVLRPLYFFEVNFSNLTIPETSLASTALSLALERSRRDGLLVDLYQIYLWNYCTSRENDCSHRQAAFAFDPLQVWRLDDTANHTSDSRSPHSSRPTVMAGVDSSLDSMVLGRSGQEVLAAYEHLASWTFTAYQIAFGASLLTLLSGCCAFTSRIASLFTSAFSAVS